MKDRNIYTLNSISEVGTKYFRNGYHLVDSIEDAAGILVRSADMHGMAFPESLRAIARAGAGTNNIPLEECAEKGIVVFNTPGANANGVKEIVVCALMLASRNIIGGAEWVKSHADDENIAADAEKAKKAFAGNEIHGKTLGVIGLGAVGVLVANAALELGMEVYGYDPFLSVRSAWQLSSHVKYADSLDHLYEVSDYITIHVPALDSTKGMIDGKAIGKMKDGVKILNFARDVLCNDDDLAEALDSGKVACYISDFANPKSAKMKNAVVLPHLGASTVEAEDNCAVMAVRQLQDYLDNGNITNSVNYPNMDAGICSTESRVGILHRNIPNMLSQITTFFGSYNHNIENLLNKAKGAYAYTLIDLSHPLPENTVDKLKEIGGVLRVRVIKG